MVALRKQHKLFVAAYNEAEAPAGFLLLSRGGRGGESSPPRLPGLFQPWSDVGGQGYWEEGPCRMSGLHHPSSTTCCPNKSSSTEPVDLVLLHKNNMQFFSVCTGSPADRGVVNVLIM